MRVDLAGLGLDQGAHLLIRRALSALGPGERLDVYGRHPALRVHLRAWSRMQGHRIEWPASDDPDGPVATVVRGARDDQRWADAVRAGSPVPGAVLDRPEPSWGLAARGALVESGGPEVHFELEERAALWSDLAPRLPVHARGRVGLRHGVVPAVGPR